MKIKNIMSSNIISADVSKSAEEISKIMLENDIGFLPITENEEVIGVITDRDIVIKILSNNDNKIDGYLSTELVTIDIEEDVEDVLKLMGEEKVKRVLITQDEDIVGVVSLSNIINKNIKACETVKRIWNIENNKEEENPEIDEFKL